MLFNLDDSLKNSNPNRLPIDPVAIKNAKSNKKPLIKNHVIDYLFELSLSSYLKKINLMSHAIKPVTTPIRRRMKKKLPKVFVISLNSRLAFISL